MDGALKVTTTHIKYSFVHRNGIPLSPYAVMTEYYWRHGDLLSLAIFVEDPVYLTEPLMRTSTFKLDPTMTVPAPLPFEIAEELPSLQKGQVPAYPLGTNTGSTHKTTCRSKPAGGSPDYRSTWNDSSG